MEYADDSIYSKSFNYSAIRVNENDDLAWIRNLVRCLFIENKIKYESRTNFLNSLCK